jgi:type III pantothenate kinase
LGKKERNLIALDIGNSDIKTGIWDGKEWIKQWRRETYPALRESEYFSIFKQMLDEVSVDPAKIGCAAVASVVPQVSESVSKALNNLLGIEPLLISTTANLGIDVKTDKPAQIGADLIAGAAAAYRLVKDTCIIVDCGTATTVMVVDNPGTLLGGAICNGLKTSVNALIDRTAQLQQIPLEIPASPIGKNTIHAMQSGLLGGHLAMIEGLIDKMIDEIGPAKVVATGGLLPVLAGHTNYFDFIEPTLVLDGIRLIAEREEIIDGK